jgi:hypothetical protein
MPFGKVIIFKGNALPLQTPKDFASKGTRYMKYTVSKCMVHEGTKRPSAKSSSLNDNRNQLGNRAGVQ